MGAVLHCQLSVAAMGYWLTFGNGSRDGVCWMVVAGSGSQ